MAHKPEGYSSVSPYLLVPDARRTLNFLAAVFDAPELRVITHADGAIMHAEAMVDDTVVMMGQMEAGPKSNVHVYVEDVDAAFERALAAGGTVVQEVMEKGDGDRRGGVDDGNGTVWWLSTQLG